MAGNVWLFARDIKRDIGTERGKEGEKERRREIIVPLSLRLSVSG
jgi:hypothetical protein